MWDVKAIEGNDEDVAYGTDCLPLHMDEVYYDGHPGINFLHCIRYISVKSTLEISEHYHKIVRPNIHTCT